MAFKLNVNIKMNPVSQIIKDHNLELDGKANRFLRDEVYRLYEPYVPSDIGELYREVTYPSNHEIKHTSPYSHYHYKGILMLAKNGSCYVGFGKRKYYTKTKMTYQGAPKRGPNWDKRMKNDRGKEVCKDLERYIKNGCK